MSNSLRPGESWRTRRSHLEQTAMISAPHHIRIGHFIVGNDQPLTLIAGPCAIESRSHALEMGHGLTEMARKLGIGLIYKSSFDKANRTSIRSNRGVGMEEGLGILAEVRQTYSCPV